MASIIRNYDFNPGRPEQYPWDEWFDGRIRRLSRHIDFPNHPASFRMSVYSAARRRGVNVQTRLETSLDDGIALVIQSY